MLSSESRKKEHPRPVSITVGCSWQYLSKLMGFKGRALASVKVTSEESLVPRQGTARWWGAGTGGRLFQNEDEGEQLRETG